MLYEGFRELSVGVVNDIVDGAEVVGGFYDVVHIHRAFSNAYGIGLEYVAGLVVRQLAPLDMV